MFDISELLQSKCTCDKCCTLKAVFYVNTCIAYDMRKLESEQYPPRIIGMWRSLIPKFWKDNRFPKEFKRNYHHLQEKGSKSRNNSFGMILLTVAEENVFKNTSKAVSRSSRKKYFPNLNSLFVPAVVHSAVFCAKPTIG